MINAKLSQHRFWPCHRNGLIKKIPMIPYYISSVLKVEFPLLWLKAHPILVVPNPQ